MSQIQKILVGFVGLIVLGVVLFLIIVLRFDFCLESFCMGGYIWVFLVACHNGWCTCFCRMCLCAVAEKQKLWHKKTCTKTG